MIDRIISHHNVWTSLQLLHAKFNELNGFLQPKKISSLILILEWKLETLLSAKLFFQASKGFWTAVHRLVGSTPHMGVHLTSWTCILHKHTILYRFEYNIPCSMHQDQLPRDLSNIFPLWTLYFNITYLLLKTPMYTICTSHAQLNTTLNYNTCTLYIKTSAENASIV